jgi:MFS family permease
MAVDFPNFYIPLSSLPPSRQGVTPDYHITMSNEKIKDSVSAEHVPDASSLKADQQDVQRGYELLELEREASLVQASIANYRILLHCLAAFCAGMVFGYDSIVNGASISMPSFLLYFGSTAKDGSAYLPSIWTSLWTAMSALLQALGGFGIGLVSDRVGRKWPCVGACVVSIGGVAMQYWATSRGLLLGGKMLNGLAIGCLTATSTAWAADVAPPRLRGPIQSCIVLFTVIMQAIGLIVVRMYVGDITERSFRHVFAIQWAWAILTAIVFAFMPESPTWLLLHDNIAETEKTLTLLYGSQNAIPARLAVLRSQIRQETLAAQEQGTLIWMPSRDPISDGP